MTADCWWPVHTVRLVLVCGGIHSSSNVCSSRCHFSAPAARARALTFSFKHKLTPSLLYVHLQHDKVYSWKALRLFAQDHIRFFADNDKGDVVGCWKKWDAAQRGQEGQEGVEVATASAESSPMDESTTSSSTSSSSDKGDKGSKKRVRDE